MLHVHALLTYGELYLHTSACTLRAITVCHLKGSVTKHEIKQNEAHGQLHLNSSTRNRHEAY